MHQWNVHVPSHAQPHRGPFPTCQRLGCLLALRRFRCRKNDDVDDGLDGADGHADVDDPNEDGGDRDRDGGLPDPEGGYHEGDDAEEPFADDAQSPGDEPSQSCVSDRVKDCRMNPQRTRQAPNTNHTGR